MLRWYVIHSKPQKELFVQEQLILRKLEAYCPVVHLQTTTPGARKVRPYFPGYLFSQIDLNKVNMSILNWLPGAMGLVHFGEEPACIPDNLLWAIRNRMDQINVASKKPLLETLEPGDEVAIQTGPFAGYEAVFCAEHHSRVQVLLQLLQDYAVRVDLPADQIRVIKKNHS
jgi:transcription antitermination factor NusG